MTISIITPSFRNSAWLKLCVASVADQKGVEFEHLVQDSCSDDGTQEWLPRDPRVKAFVEKDAGMYDAVNRGFRRASGEILAYLNCDEQYLPGTLEAVAAFFAARPEADILLTHTLVTDPAGQYLCSRKSMVPWRLTRWVFLPIVTCSLFFRRRVVQDYNLYFDARWRDVADAIWIREAMALRLKFMVLPRYTSIFTETGENMNLKPNALREKRIVARTVPTWSRWLARPLLQLHRLRSVFAGVYWDKPFSYSLYTLASPERRVEVPVSKPTGIWWQRHSQAKAER